MGKIDNLYDQIYQLRIKRDSLDRFRTSEREELEKKMSDIKKKISLLRNPPPEKRKLIDELMNLRSDIAIIYSDPIVELSSFTVEELQHHLERSKKGHRFFKERAVREIKMEREEKFGVKKVYPPSIKDLILKALKEKEHTLEELFAKIPGNQQTIKATLTYHLKKQGYNIEVIKEGTIEKYKLNGYLDIISKEEEIVSTEKIEDPIVAITVVKPKVSYPKEGVFNFIIKLMKEKSYTMKELAELSGASLSTIKQNILYTAKNKGVTITPIAEAGYSELKYMVKSSIVEV